MRRSNKLRALEGIKGLNFSDCVAFFGERTRRERRIAKLARERLCREGELEVDDKTVVSEGDDNGAYVMSWAWVDFVEVPGLDKESDV